MAHLHFIVIMIYDECFKKSSKGKCNAGGKVELNLITENGVNSQLSCRPCTKKALLQFPDTSLSIHEAVTERPADTACDRNPALPLLPLWYKCFF